MPTLEERIQKSQTRVVKLVFPGLISHQDHLFGGTALQWMDEVAVITGTRFSRKRLVTASLDRIDFKKGIPVGTLVELIGTVKKVGRTSMQVEVDIVMEQLYTDERESVIKGIFTLVTIDENRKPIPVLDE
ncbi:MAG: acyl-CoA thioesterase [Candidatus Zixiibacteriota bacterium]